MTDINLDALQELKLDWHTEKRKVSALVPYEHNPRMMTAEQMRQLRESLEEFGLVEIPAINLDDTLIAGHQRCKAMMLLGMGEQEIDVRVPSRMLTAKELKRYNLASNAIKGNWLEDVLKSHFADVNMDDYGLKVAEMDELLKRQEEKTAEPEYPIVAKFSESYDAFIIVCNNEIDSNFVRQVMQQGTVQSYKSKNVGSTHVIDAKDFAKLWTSKS